MTSFLCAVFFCGAAFGAAPDESARLFERAKNLYGIQEYSHALVLFEKALELEPENGEAWDYASWCQRYLGNWETARRGFEKAGELLPGEAAKWVKVGLGETYFGGGLYKNAVQSFLQAIDLAPGDEELVVRSLKGAALAFASMGDSVQLEKTLARLTEKDAADIRPDAEKLLERARQATQTEPAEAVLSDIRERQEQTFQAASESSEVREPQNAASETESQEGAAPQKPAELEKIPEHQEGSGAEIPAAAAVAAAEPESLFTLGEPMQAVLTRFAERGIEVRKVEAATAIGSQFYTLRVFEEFPLPEVIRGDANAVFCALEEFQEKLLSVTVSLTWKELPAPIRMKEELFREISDKLKEKYGAWASLSDNGIFAEASWIAGGARLVYLTITAGLDGQVVLNAGCTDLPGLEVFWDNARKANEQR
ncbi:MAG: hypothetical protein LBO82_10485 [Synergistaceae bacterium]|nr:hypothetical protein [Synergistaceae bacterium]